MLLKDYYTILGLEPGASNLEIKKAYRRLAQQYHPDKNQQEPYATTQFAEIKEAYEVLTNPGKKDQYLQRRWYNQSAGRRRTQPVITPVAVLKQSLELEIYVSRLDHFRMDKEGLRDYISELISPGTIEKLNSFNEAETNDAIATTLMSAMTPLPFIFIETLCLNLSKLATSQGITHKIETFVAARKKNADRDRYKIGALLLLVLLFCALIILIS